MQAPAAHVLFEDAVLFPQRGNHLKLAAIHPPGEGDEQNLPSDRVEHPPSLPATAALTIRARLNFRIVRPRTHPAHAEGASCITVPVGTAKMEIPDWAITADSSGYPCQNSRQTSWNGERMGPPTSTQPFSRFSKG